MAVWLFLAFVVLPLVELYLLLTLGAWLGFWSTLATALVTAALGGWLAKREGLRVLREWWRSVSEGRMPEAGLLDGVLVLVGAVLLMTPGFLSDTAGLLLMFRPSRRVAAALVRRAIDRRLASGSLRVERVAVSSAGFGGLDDFGADPLDALGRAARRGGVVDTVGEDVAADGASSGARELPPSHR